MFWFFSLQKILVILDVFSLPLQVTLHLSPFCLVLQGGSLWALHWRALSHSCWQWDLSIRSTKRKSDLQSKWDGIDLFLCFSLLLSTTLNSGNNIKDTKGWLWKVQIRWTCGPQDRSDSIVLGHLTATQPTETHDPSLIFLNQQSSNGGSQGRLIFLLGQTRDSLTIPGEPSRIRKWNKAETHWQWVAKEHALFPCQAREPTPRLRHTRRQDDIGWGESHHNKWTAWKGSLFAWTWGSPPLPGGARWPDLQKLLLPY